MSRFVKLGTAYFRPEDVKVIEPIAERSGHCRVTMTDGGSWTIPISPSAAAEALNARD